MMMMMMVMMMMTTMIIQLRDQLLCVIRCTERVTVLLNCIRQGLGSNLAGAPTILTGVCYGFPQSLQANIKTASFHIICNSLFTSLISFYAM